MISPARDAGLRLRGKGAHGRTGGNHRPDRGDFGRLPAGLAGQAGVGDGGTHSGALGSRPVFHQPILGEDGIRHRGGGFPHGGGGGPDQRSDVPCAASGVRRINVIRAEEMLKAVLGFPADIIIKAAAVADYRPVTVSDRKMKKRDETIEIRMERTPDIALEVGKRKGNRFLVGFAAETDHVEENAREKLRRKGMDLIVANDVTAEGAGFEVDTNIAAVYDQKGLVARWPRMSKERMAERLIALIGERLNDR